MIDFFNRGGLLMWPLLACSIGMIAIIIERFVMLYLRRGQILSRTFLVELHELLRSKRFDDARLLSMKDGSIMAMIALSGLVRLEQPRTVIKESMESTGRFKLEGLESFLAWLNTIAGISPLLGLLGTVIGMMKIFNVIFLDGLGDATKLAGGISEALITTVAGLSVAIPAYTAYRIYSGSIRSISRRLEEEGAQILEMITTDSEGPKAA